MGIYFKNVVGFFFKLWGIWLIILKGFCSLEIFCFKYFSDCFVYIRKEVIILKLCNKFLIKILVDSII